MSKLATWFAARRVAVNVIRDGWREAASVIGATTRPLLFVYSGHGDVVVDEHGAPRSVLCAEDPPLDAAKLLAAIPAQAGWAVLVLNACSSAYVDASAARVRTSILSASSEELSAGDADAGPDTATFFVQSLLAALEDAAIDVNRDSVITDQELFLTSRAWLRGHLPYTLMERAPLPVLRRNAESDLPLLRLTGAGSACGLSRAGLDENLARQAHPECLELPSDEHDYFVWGNQPSTETAQRIEQELSRLGVRPLKELGVAEEEAVRIARAATFLEIYRLDVDAVGWLHARRLRDGRLMVTRPLDRLDLSALGRTVVVTTTASGEAGVVRYSRSVPSTALGKLERVTVCAEGEGQCFHYQARH